MLTQASSRCSSGTTHLTQRPKLPRQGLQASPCTATGVRLQNVQLSVGSAEGAIEAQPCNAHLSHTQSLLCSASPWLHFLTFLTDFLNVLSFCLRCHSNALTPFRALAIASVMSSARESTSSLRWPSRSALSAWSDLSGLVSGVTVVFSSFFSGKAPSVAVRFITVWTSTFMVALRPLALCPSPGNPALLTPDALFLVRV
mmetsp:Transcript_9295/g.19985  ORF Transcript_9295/g.19985 Transcript_9295/m.19985 type:complete len:200 (-) Transcript_9295:481-1080(-)